MVLKPFRFYYTVRDSYNEPETDERERTIMAANRSDAEREARKYLSDFFGDDDTERYDDDVWQSQSDGRMVEFNGVEEERTKAKELRRRISSVRLVIR